MSRIRKYAAFVLAVAVLVIGTLALTGTHNSASAANAVYATTSRTKTLISGRCYHTHQVTTTYFRWNTKAGHYLRLVSPTKVVTDSTTCHS